MPPLKMKKRKREKENEKVLKEWKKGEKERKREKKWGKTYKWTYDWRLNEWTKRKQVPKTYNSPYARRKRAEEEEKNRLEWERMAKDNAIQEEIDRRNRADGNSYQGSYTEGWAIDKRSPDPERYTKPKMEFGADGDFADRKLWDEKLKHAMEKNKMLDQYRKLRILSRFNKTFI